MSEKEYLYDAEVEELLQGPLNFIVSLPKETTEEKKKCWNEFKAMFPGKEWNSLLELLALAHWGKSLEKLVLWQSENDYKENKDAATDFNAEIWLESLRKTVLEFEFNEVNFIRRLKVNYQRLYNNGRQRWYIDNRTAGADINQSRKIKLNRLLQEYVKVLHTMKEELLENEKDDRTIWRFYRESVREKLKEEFSWCTKQLLEEVEQLYQLQFVSRYSGEGEEENDLLDNVAYQEEDGSYALSGESVLICRETAEENKKRFYERMNKLEKLFHEIPNVETRACFRAFLTKDILIALKLETGAGADGEEEKFVTRREDRKDGKELKLHRFSHCPAGNEGVYQMLEQEEYLLIENLLHHEYIREAVEKRPESLETLYGIYYNLLRQDFKFADNVIGALLGLDKRKLSRLVKYYMDFVEKA